VPALTHALSFILTPPPRFSYGFAHEGAPSLRFAAGVCPHRLKSDFPSFGSVVTKKGRNDMTRWKILSVLSVLSILLVVLVLAQGPLVPPGTPGATMKTLEQVEPRTPIGGSVDITTPGSYYLTTNIVPSGGTPAIMIRTNNVKLDLNGFSILGASARGSGIGISDNVGNVVIENGTISDCYYYGIHAGGASNCVFRNLRVMGHAQFSTAYAGILAGTHAVVESSRVLDSGGKGVVAGSGSVVTGNVIENQATDGLGLTGSGSYVADNIVKGNGDNYNITAGNQLNILLCEVPEALDWPCSVKFAGTLTCSQTGVNGITVNADDVTIDLDGHTLVGPGPGGSNPSGIHQDSSFRNLTVSNGKIIRWIGGKGVYAAGSSARIAGMQSHTNNCGVETGKGSMIRDCAAMGNYDLGIKAGPGSTVSGCIVAKTDSPLTIGSLYASEGSTVSRCAAYDNDGYGIVALDGVITDCSAQHNGDTGIVIVGGLVSDCSAENNEGFGIAGDYRAHITRCMVSGNTRGGIVVNGRCLVKGNNCSANGLTTAGSGIRVWGSNSRIEDNNVTGSDRGIDVNGSDNFIARNTASGNTTNWDVAGTNVCYVIQANKTSAPFTGNSGGAVPGNDNPWANFSY
jgi:parallel beta-helix repeat protein